MRILEEVENFSGDVVRFFFKEVVSFLGYRSSGFDMMW